MKRIRTLFLLFAFFLGITLQSNAQAPYKHSIGATLGTTQAVSYKTFPTDHFAIQLDLGTNYCWVYGIHTWAFELAPNFMYEGRLAGGLYGFVGGGGSIGYNWQTYWWIPREGQNVPWDNTAPYLESKHNGKAGLNGFFGLEYKFNIPLTLQLDFRPGYRCVFTRYFSDHIFDWGLNFGVRYTF